MSKRITRRDIELIPTELQGALKREATDIIAKPMLWRLPASDCIAGPRGRTRWPVHCAAAKSL